MLRPFALALLAASAIAAPVLAEPAFRLEHAAARLVVVAEDRPDVAYTVTPGKAALPTPQMRREGDTLILDGGLEPERGHSRIKGCDARSMGHTVDGWEDWSIDLGRSVRIDGLGSVEPADLPLVTVRVPLDAHVQASGAVFGEIGRTRSLNLASGGCGDWKVGDVQGAMKVALGGSGALHAGRADKADISIGGSGDVWLTDAAALTANIGGSGMVRARTVNGPVNANIGGSGNVVIDGGTSPRLSANVAGSGNLIYKGTAGSVAASIVGSGGIRVKAVTGPISKTVLGSGGVRVGL